MKMPSLSSSAGVDEPQRPEQVPVAVFATEAPPGWRMIGAVLGEKVQVSSGNLNSVSGKSTVRLVKFTVRMPPAVRAPVSPKLLVGVVPPTKLKANMPVFAAMTSGGVIGPDR